MRSTRLPSKTVQRPGRTLRGIYLILQTRKTYGYNSVLERIFRYLVTPAPGQRQGSIPRRRMLFDRL